MTSVFEEENLPKAILRVGLPAMLGQLTTLIYNMADTFFVSLTKEPAMIAAVTLCTPILLIIMSIACVFGMGGSSVIGQASGRGKTGVRGKDPAFLHLGHDTFRCVYRRCGIASAAPNRGTCRSRCREYGLYL